MKFFTIIVFLAALAAAEDRTCWLRNGSAPAPNLVYLLCEQGAVVMTTDGGATWATRPTSAKAHLRKLLVSEDGGENWRAIPVEDQLFVAQMLSVGDSLWAIGQLGALKSTGDPTKWKRIDTLMTDDPGRDTTDTAAH